MVRSRKSIVNLRFTRIIEEDKNGIIQLRFRNLYTPFCDIYRLKTEEIKRVLKIYCLIKLNQINPGE